MDLSKFSTEDLQALRARDLSKMSTQGLQLLRTQVATPTQAEKATAPEAPLGSRENPGEADLYGDPNSGYLADAFKGFPEARARAAASFGNVAGLKAQLEKNGWSDIQEGPDGDLIAKGPDGKYYKDAASLLKHPLNWAESKVGGALPTAGMVLGGAGGAALGAPGAPETAGATSVALGAGGAALGGGLGETARSSIGKKLGTYQGTTADQVNDANREAVGSALAELGGKLVGMVPIPFTGKTVDGATKAGLEALVARGKGAMTKASSLLTGVDQDAYMRQLERPTQVRTALEPGNALRVATQAQAEREAKDDTESRMISQARQQFQQKYGREPMNTQELVNFTQDAIDRNLPNSSGKSGMKPEELDELEGLKRNDFGTQQTVQPAVKASKVSFETQPSVLRDASGNPIERTVSVPGPEFEAQPAVVQTNPVKQAGELQRTADWMQQQIPKSSYEQTIPGARTEKSVGTYQGLLGRLKQAFHVMSPELGAADARYSEYVDNSKLLGPLDRAAQGESFIDNLFGKNKGAVREAAKAVIPHTYEDAADIGAAKALKSDRLSRLGPSAPAIMRMGTPIMTSMAGFGAGSYEGGLLGLGAGTALSIGTSPWVHENMTYLAGKYGMPVVNMLVKNPQLAPALLDTQDARRMMAKAPNVWSSLKTQGEANGN